MGVTREDVRLSVVMPVYNGAAYLRDALESVATQAEGVELVCVDDGSTDDSVEIVKSFTNRLNLRLVEPGRSGNWVAATNAGIRAAKTERLCMLHQDDLWLPGRMERLRHTPDERLVTHDARLIDSAGRTLGNWRCPIAAGRVDPEAFVRKLVIQNNLAIGSPVFYREDALAAGGLNERLWYTADWDLWLRLGSQYGAFHFAESLTAFRVHPQSQTVSRPDHNGGMRAQMLEVVDRYLPAIGGGDRERKRIRQVAEFSAELNAALAGRVRGQKAGWLPISRRFARLGPAGWAHYVRDSRIIERASARLKSKPT
jgi:hypothetical protein